VQCVAVQCVAACFSVLQCVAVRWQCVAMTITLRRLEFKRYWMKRCVGVCVHVCVYVYVCARVCVCMFRKIAVTPETESKRYWMDEVCVRGCGCGCVGGRSGGCGRVCVCVCVCIIMCV